MTGSKSEYERKLKAWRCGKNRSQDTWKFISLRLKESEAQGKQSDVYIDGNLIEKTMVRKRTARAHVTFLESYVIRE